MIPISITSEKVRLQKILSAYAIASRRESERIISEGRVSVNGVTARLGESAQISVDAIEVDGIPLEAYRRRVYIMLNKPRGYLTTVSDDRGRKTVMELVSDIDARLYPIGRLDMDSEGLLLLTNDGDFANAVAHPSNNKVKTYEVRIDGNAPSTVKRLKKPMNIDGRTIRTTDVKLVSDDASGGVLRISIVEGRNRQVRKMCSVCGVTVKSLRRISIGPLELGQLETGKWRHLTASEVESLGIKKHSIRRAGGCGEEHLSQKGSRAL